MNRSLVIVWHFLLLTVVQLSNVDGDPVPVPSNQTPADCSCVGCICVFYYQCQKDGTANQGGVDLIRPRFNAKACPPGKYKGEIKCCKRKLDTNPETFMCGKSEKSGVSKSIFWGDQQYEICGKNEFPWITAIFRNENGNYNFFTSGSLIAPRVILTANHYISSEHVQSGDLKIVYNGGNELPTVNKQPEDERNVNEIISHPDYDSSWINDIALIILDKPYDIPKPADMKSICLPPEGDRLEKGERCIVAGWGRDVVKNGYTVMQKVELPHVDDFSCEHTMLKVGKKTFHNTFLCAGGEKNKDACHGDGGSPLMCLIRGTTDKYYIAGMVSWGLDCGIENIPGVYTNIRTLKDWILNELQSRNLWTA